MNIVGLFFNTILVNRKQLYIFRYIGEYVQLYTYTIVVFNLKKNEINISNLSNINNIFDISFWSKIIS
ncbi:hypothetical protein MARI151_30002 [Maribacter litoralis]|uniref:Uncharacterized protein n=1 Tax=Maribacter litoralis TaxID=2059726 RepID=A0A653RM13_9FLAO|nr:hypothetical protein MARI151_30002 [Maribacter litoralis]